VKGEGVVQSSPKFLRVPNLSENFEAHTHKKREWGETKELGVFSSAVLLCSDLALPAHRSKGTGARSFEQKEAEKRCAFGRTRQRR